MNKAPARCAIVDYDEALMYARRGEPDPQRAAPLLEVALRQFRALGMPGWIRRAEHLLRTGTEWRPAPQDPSVQSVPAADEPSEQPRSEAMQSVGGVSGAMEQKGAASTSATRHLKPESVFRNEGNYWTIEYAGRGTRLKDSKGIRYLAHLLRHPGQEFVALELVQVARDATDAPESRAAESVAAAFDSGHGPLLDAQAKAAYKERLAELRDELLEAESMNDMGRAERAQVEIEFITQQVAAAVGLGGRDRAGGSDTERARQTVTKGIKRAIANIRAANPVAGRHFAQALHTGSFCAYMPDSDDCPEWRF